MPYPRALPLSPEAAEFFKDWHEDNRADRASDGFPQHLDGAWAKMPGQLGRLALIFRCVRGAYGEHLPDAIDLASAQAAARFIEAYFKPNAKRVYRRLLNSPLADGPKILAYILRQGGRAMQSDIFSHALGGNVPSPRMLAELERHREEGVLDSETIQDPVKTGRPPTWWFFRSCVPGKGV